MGLEPTTFCMARTTAQRDRSRPKASKPHGSVLPAGHAARLAPQPTPEPD